MIPYIIIFALLAACLITVSILHLWFMIPALLIITGWAILIDRSKKRDRTR